MKDPSAAIFSQLLAGHASQELLPSVAFVHSARGQQFQQLQWLFQSQNCLSSFQWFGVYQFYLATQNPGELWWDVSVFTIDSPSEKWENFRRRLENCKRSKVTTSGRGLFCQPRQLMMLDLNRTWHGDSRDLNVEDRIISLPQNSRVVDGLSCHVFPKTGLRCESVGTIYLPKNNEDPKTASGNLPFDPIS